jgi:hypothetical protein
MFRGKVESMTTDEPLVNAGRLDAVVEAALAVHGVLLDDAQREILRENAERLRGMAEQLDRFHLENADEPDFSFRVIDRVDAV